MPKNVLDSEIKACAFRLLARREHSRYELRQKLLLRDYDVALVEDVLDYMAEEHWQSDERFTENYVRSRINKGYGRLKIQAELQERAVDSSLIAIHLSQDEDFWFEQIKQVWQKKFNKSLPKLTAVRGIKVEPERRNAAYGERSSVSEFANSELMKQYRFLQSRGFTGEDIKRLWTFIYEK
jgi:regulatory protein